MRYAFDALLLGVLVYISVCLFWSNAFHGKIPGVRTPAFVALTKTGNSTVCKIWFLGALPTAYYSPVLLKGVNVISRVLGDNLLLLIFASFLAVSVLVYMLSRLQRRSPLSSFFSGLLLLLSPALPVTTYCIGDIAATLTLPLLALFLCLITTPAFSTRHTLLFYVCALFVAVCAGCVSPRALYTLWLIWLAAVVCCAIHGSTEKGYQVPLFTILVALFSATLLLVPVYISGVVVRGPPDAYLYARANTLSPAQIWNPDNYAAPGYGPPIVILLTIGGITALLFRRRLFYTVILLYATVALLSTGFVVYLLHRAILQSTLARLLFLTPYEYVTYALVPGVVVAATPVEVLRVKPPAYASSTILARVQRLRRRLLAVCLLVILIVSVSQYQVLSGFLRKIGFPDGICFAQRYRSICLLINNHLKPGERVAILYWPIAVTFNVYSSREQVGGGLVEECSNQDLYYAMHYYLLSSSNVSEVLLFVQRTNTRFIIISYTTYLYNPNLSRIYTPPYFTVLYADREFIVFVTNRSLLDPWFGSPITVVGGYADSVTAQWISTDTLRIQVKNAHNLYLIVKQSFIPHWLYLHTDGPHVNMSRDPIGLIQLLIQGSGTITLRFTQTFELRITSLSCLAAGITITAIYVYHLLRPVSEAEEAIKLAEELLRQKLRSKRT